MEEWEKRVVIMEWDIIYTHMGVSICTYMTAAQHVHSAAYALVCEMLVFSYMHMYLYADLCV